ncbi:cytochrome P450 [Mytilinidion resinicola]|uniref:Cytochrome P450 n=1 Tax=Mytilinidion resinicola TaxID=574789 RepID=A0A6A6YWG5_9PEZI|nr:cytochrome P450 [Mytilinidion resinicola]KAF2812733.1 cytochrome P450 [Mytilinidion resinicola]
MAIKRTLSRYWMKHNNHGRSKPLVVYPKIPVFGHAIVQAHSPQGPIPPSNHNTFTSWAKVYTVFSVPLIQAVQKQNKALAFEPIQAKFSVKLCGSSQEAYHILEEDMDTENGKYGNIYLAMHQALNLGKTLNELNQAMALRHHVNLATTDAVYGPHNPFQNPNVEGAFWEFEREIPKLLYLPDWLARNGVRNRKLVADAFQNYFCNDYHKQASGLVQDFHTSEIAYGFSLSDRSLFEVGHALAILANTSAAVFWTVFYVFSTPGALREIREEISTIITSSVDDANTRKHCIDMTKVNTNCPILVSTFREAIRLHSIGISLRQVCKDSVLDGTYYLRKDAMVLMPTAAIHTNPLVWGPDVLEFNYRRFHPSNPHKVSPAAFRSFGGGTTLCPGRHFATTQVMAWTIMLVTRFDMEPVVGQWVQPTTENTNLANVMMSLDHDFHVEMSAREIYRDGNWSMRVTNNDAMFGATVEDLEWREKE